MTQSIDLSECEKEPVRFINMIQPFGAILRTNSDQLITHYSANLATVTKLEGKTLVGRRYSPELLSPIAFSQSVINLETGQLIEIEFKENQRYQELNPLLDKLQTAPDMSNLLLKAAEVMQEMSGFDRVMVYKFHDDLHGEVVSEVVRPGTDSFLGLHFPASDIPSQARSIFLENWVRLISDVNYTAVEIVGLQGESTLDLGKSLLRAVSPIHIEYLKNMSVGASLTVSMIIEGKLWGLFACHHNSPRYLPKSVRDNCEVVSRMTSALIRDSHLKEISFHANKLRSIHEQLLSKTGLADDLSGKLTKYSPNLVDIIKSEGAAAALYVDGYWATVGQVPTNQELDNLVGWLSSQDVGDVFTTDRLCKIYPEAEAYKSIASGLIAASVPKNKRSYILWFRPEFIQSVKWAGNPEKVVNSVNGRLTPRASFEEWKEKVYGTSIPWKTWEIDAAVLLRNSVLALDLRRQFEKEQKAREEAERAKHSREELMAMVSHDLKNPLSSIQMNAQLLKRFLPEMDEKSRSITERIFKSSVMMNNLIDDILCVTKLEAGHVSIDAVRLSLHSVIDEAIEVLGPIAAHKNVRLKREDESFNFETEYDYGRMLQVFSNIIGNAIKFTPDGGTISVKVEKSGHEFVVASVRDSGPGIPKEHLPSVFDRFWQAHQTKRLGTGLGLAISKGIVEAHGGEIWAESEAGQGATFLIRLPVESSINKVES